MAQGPSKSKEKQYATEESTVKDLNRRLRKDPEGKGGERKWLKTTTKEKGESGLS